MSRWYTGQDILQAEITHAIFSMGCGVTKVEKVTGGGVFGGELALYGNGRKIKIPWIRLVELAEDEYWSRLSDQLKAAAIFIRDDPVLFPPQLMECDR